MICVSLLMFRTLYLYCFGMFTRASSNFFLSWCSFECKQFTMIIDFIESCLSTLLLMCYRTDSLIQNQWWTISIPLVAKQSGCLTQGSRRRRATLPMIVVQKAMFGFKGQMAARSLVCITDLNKIHRHFLKR